MKISAVSYLNTKPFIYGLEQLPEGTIELSLDIPSECSRKLLSGEVEIGLVPVAVLKQMPEHHIISDFCIGAVGKVDSVKLYSQVPLNEITEVVLDYHSKTSVALVKILANELWKICPIWTAAEQGFETEIEGTKAAVIIGDRTFGLTNKYAFEYDLSEAWKELTGLPFVFAVWASRKKLDSAFELKFSNALHIGIESAKTVSEINQPHYPEIDVFRYLTKSISYHLDHEKRKAIELFLEKLE